MDTKALRQKILDLAIRGKLVPQDPTDEPASVLLERIRAERQRLVKEGKLKAKDVKNDSIIYKDPSDNLHYEKFSDGTIKCIEDEIPFDIPESWCWTRLGNISSMSAGKFKASAEIGDKSADKPFPCYGGNGIRGYVKNHSHEGFYHLIGRQGALCGNINIASGKFYATEHAVVVTLFQNTNFYWIYYLLCALNLNQYSTGAAQPGLSVEKILNTIVPLPPHNEQKLIACHVDNVLTRIKLLDSSQDELKNYITILKSKILDLAIRGKLVPQDPNDEPASVLLERIKAEKEELIKQGRIKRDKAESTIFKGDDNSYYGYVPTNWTLCSLADIAEIELGKTLDTAKNTGTYRPYLRSLNIKWGAVDLTDIKQMRIEDTELQRYSIQKNDLLICEGGDVGRAYVWNKDINFCYQNAIHRVRFYKNCNPYYFYYVMVYLDSIGYLKEISTGVTIKHLTKNILIRIPFLLPPLAEQHRIVTAIETTFAELDKISTDIT